MQEFQLTHPTSVNRIEIPMQRSMKVYSSGFPWWKNNDKAKKNKFTDSNIVFEFDDIFHGRIDLENMVQDTYKEDLDDLEVVLVPRQPIISIYCSSPVRNFFAVYEFLHDYLATKDYPFEVLDLLHGGNSITIQRCRKAFESNSFLAFEGPEPLAVIIEKLFGEQGVNFRRQPIKTYYDEHHWVTFMGNSFYCQKSFVEFD